MLHKFIRGGFGIFLILMLSGAALFSFGAIKKTGVYWTRFDSTDKLEAATSLLENPSDPETESSGFLVVDVSNIPGTDFADETEEQDLETIFLGIGPLPEAPFSTGDPDVELIEIQPGASWRVAGDGEDDESELAESSRTPANVYWKTVTVKVGDTLSGIAETAGIPMQDVVRANDLKHADRVREGQILYIPLDSSRVLETLAYVRQLAAEEEILRKKVLPLQITYYAVKEGDSLWSIASAFDLDINTLFSCNKLEDVNLLKPGTTLRIPNQDGAFVKARPGDTLSQIAEQNGAYIEAVVTVNRLSSERALVAGDEIFVPGAKNVTVAKDDSPEKSSRGKSARAARSFSWPVRGQISSRFGWRTDPFGRRRDLHTGLDIRAPRGRAIVAASDGRVVFSGWMGGYGRTIVISHPGGNTTLYGHCHKLIASKGQRVKRGQLIAHVGSTGRSTGNHLHFEVRTGRGPANPLRMLR